MIYRCASFIVLMDVKEILWNTDKAKFHPIVMFLFILLDMGFLTPHSNMIISEYRKTILVPERMLTSASMSQIWVIYQVTKSCKFI